MEGFVSVGGKGFLVSSWCVSTFLSRRGFLRIGCAVEWGLIWLC